MTATEQPQNEVEPKKTKKKKLPLIVRFFIFLIVLCVFVTGSLYVVYFTTRVNSEEFIADDFVILAKIDSIKNFYDNIIDLRAAETVLSTDELSRVYKSLLDFKANDLSKNRFIIFLLSIKASIIIEKDYSPTVIFNPRLKSVFIRLFPLFKSFVKSKHFTLVQTEKEGYSVFTLTLKNGTPLFFSIKNNLVFLSTKEANIDKLYSTYKAKNSIYKSPQLKALRTEIRKGGIAEIYLSTTLLLNSFTENNPKMETLTKEFSFNSKSTASFNISNENIFLSAFTNIETENTLFRDFLDYNPKTLEVARYLPDTTTIYTSINFKSFEDFYKIILYLQHGQYDDLLKKVDNALRAFFRLGIDEIIFSWIGNEIGFFSVNTSTDPVIFLKIGNRRKLDGVIDKLVASVLLEGDDSLVFDTVRLSKIGFPDALQKLIGNFVKGFDTPFYIIMDDFIYFSMDPANLANLKNRYENKQTLERKEHYKKVTENSRKNANIFMYYDLSSKMPPFLGKKNMMTSILKLYEKGLVSIYFRKDSLKVDVSAWGINQPKTRPFPGYPKKVDKGIYSDITCRNIAGSRAYELIYTRKDNKLIVADINNNPISGFPIDVESKSSPYIFYNTTTKKDEIFIFSHSGKVNKVNTVGQVQAPFPTETPFKGSFAPVEYGNNLLFYTKSDKKLVFLNKKSAEKTDFSFDFSSPLLQAPGVLGNRFVFYPKTFSGTVFITDNGGTVAEGWPQEGGGISFCSPQFANLYNNNKLFVVFLTQKGGLNVWNDRGHIFENFPVKVKGVYYANPAVGNVSGNRNREIVTLDKDGIITITDHKGQTVKQLDHKDISGKETGIVLFDIDRDHIEEIFIYGGSNNIFAFNGNLEELPGFPVTGSTKPSFADLNADGLYELVTGSFDKNIYIYTLDK